MVEPEPPPAALQVIALRKQFGGVLASAGIDFDVAPGECHAVIGPNGAGKSTLVKQISGELRPDAGRILFDGHDVTSLPLHRRARLGMGRSFQISSVLRNFSVRDNLRLATQATRSMSNPFGPPAADDHSTDVACRALLGRIGLLGRDDILAGQLSYGEQRRLEIAVALAREPRLLILDEPLAGVGHAEGRQLIALLAGLKGQVSMLLVEHDIDAVFALADRITVLVNGAAIVTGRPDVIRAHPEVRTAYLGVEHTADA